MKKKPIIIAAAVVAAIPLLYFGTWFGYRQLVWMPHVKNASESLSPRTDSVTGETDYFTSTDTEGCSYYIAIPRCGIFDCHISANSNDNEGISISMIAIFNMKGEIPSYIFDVDRKAPPAGQADYVHIQLNADGELMNEDDLTNQELALYNETEGALHSMLDNARRIFAVS